VQIEKNPGISQEQGVREVAGTGAKAPVYKEMETEKPGVGAERDTMTIRIIVK
jgi:hypothetical protein